jgi:hypothetical protein
MQTPPVPPQILAPRPAGRTLIAIAAAALVGLGVAACGNDEEEPLAVLPITAHLAFCSNPNDLNTCQPTSPVTADPVIFIEPVVESGNDALDTVVPFRVMLRTSTTYTFDSINLQISFNPALAQVVANLGSAQLFPALMPGTTCNGPAACDPRCTDNCDESGNGECNRTGQLLIGISRKSDQEGCSSFSTGTLAGPTEILTLGLSAASVDASAVDLVDLPSLTGDCEILHWEPPMADPPITQLPIPCDDGGATLVPTR